MTIFFVGMMGCGKTTLGIELAQCLDVPFVDLDEYIEERCNATIGEIFATVGEARFREIESAALRDVAAESGAVVATGGGTPCHGDNMRLMNELGLTIWLHTTTEVLTSRLLLPSERSKRPLIVDMDDEQIAAHVAEQLAQREPYYRQAQLAFDSTDIETAAATRATAAALAQVLASVL